MYINEDTLKNCYFQVQTIHLLCWKGAIRKNSLVASTQGIFSKMLSLEHQGSVAALV